MRIDRLKFFLDSMGGGAWPFLVGGVICLVNSVNERDLDLLNSSANLSARLRSVALAPPSWRRLRNPYLVRRDFRVRLRLLRGTIGVSRRKFEAITGL